MHVHVAIGSEGFPEARLPLAVMIVPCHPDRVVTVRCLRRHIAWTFLRGVHNHWTIQECSDLEFLRTCRCDMLIDIIVLGLLCFSTMMDSSLPLAFATSDFGDVLRGDAIMTCRPLSRRSRIL